MIHDKHKGPAIKWDIDGRKMVGYLIRDASGRYVTKGSDRDGLAVYFQACDPLEGMYYWVHSAGYETMPTKDITSETRSTSLDAKPGTWESVNWKVPPEHQAAHCMNAPEQQPVKRFEATGIEVGGGMLYRKPNGETTWHASEREELEAQVSAARAEANDLMQRLTESQQEVAKAVSMAKEMATSRSVAWSGVLAAEKERDEARQELAEVKAERDRLAAQVEASRQKHLSDAHYEGVLESVIANVRAAIDGK